MQNIIFYLTLIILVISSVTCECPEIKSKRQWGGIEALTTDYQIIPIDYVIMHHTVGPKCSSFSECSTQVKNIQDYHMKQLGWSDIGYNFLVGNDGNVYEGVGWHKIGAHAIGYNSKSTGIAFLGDFTNELPTQSALNVTKKLLSCGVEKCELSRRFKLLGARQVISTESPGLKLYNEIQDWDNWSSKP